MLLLCQNLPYQVVLKRKFKYYLLSLLLYLKMGVFILIFIGLKDYALLVRISLIKKEILIGFAKPEILNKNHSCLVQSISPVLI